VSTFLFGSPIDDVESYVDGLLVLARDALNDPKSSPEEIADAEELLAADRAELIVAMQRETQSPRRHKHEAQGMRVDLSPRESGRHGAPPSIDAVAATALDRTAAKFGSAADVASQVNIANAKHMERIFGDAHNEILSKYGLLSPSGDLAYTLQVIGPDELSRPKHEADDFAEHVGDRLSEQRSDDKAWFIVPSFTRANHDD
jgi:hypothetical protein